MKAGVYVYGIASAAAGVMDFIWGNFDASHQPIQAFGEHIPGQEILAYITAVWMVVGGAAILWRRSARAGGAMLAPAQGWGTLVRYGSYETKTLLGWASLPPSNVSHDQVNECHGDLTPTTITNVS